MHIILTEINRTSIPAIEGGQESWFVVPALVSCESSQPAGAMCSERLLSTRRGLTHFSIAVIQIEESCLSASASSVPEYVVVPKSRISYSRQLLPLNDADLTKFIIDELAAVGVGANTSDKAALQGVLRAVEDNLRLCRNLCYAGLIATCLDHQRLCTVSHVNNALLRPH